MFDYMEELDHILRQWCAANGFNYVTCYSAWPTFQTCIDHPQDLNMTSAPKSPNPEDPRR